MLIPKKDLESRLLLRIMMLIKKMCSECASDLDTQLLIELSSRHDML